MTIYIYILLALILAAVAGGILWDWRLSGRMFRSPMPRLYRNRTSQEALWRERYGDARLLHVERILRTFCDAFMFNPEDRYKFFPYDRLQDIYRACYPRWKIWKLGDSMEIESLIITLEKEEGIEVLDYNPNISLGDLVELAIKKRKTDDLTS
jgi:hypothetical protein